MDPEEPITEEMAALLTDGRRAEVEMVLFGDLENPSPQERLERVSDALFWTMVIRIPTGRSSRKAGQGTVDLMISEVRKGRTRKESQEALMTIRKELLAEAGESDSSKKSLD
ncbi:MAG: hypothetical protein U1D32_00945 [Patescibacteria group bacterium]|nr:hypothetical protein [Patescibacteria group bacterium]